MLLSKCAACAAPLGLALGKKCGRCSTRYYGPACQEQHWKSGHDKLCKKIKNGSGAEQYHADNKYKEAVVVAAEACAEDTQGQTCYICTEGIKRRTGEGLVSGFCACRGGSSVAHVSYLAEQAKVLVAEAEENNLDPNVKCARWARWYSCSLCEQSYHGVVRCALGWACWRTYCGESELQICGGAMQLLGNGLDEAGKYQDSLSVFEALHSVSEQMNNELATLACQGNISKALNSLGRDEESLTMRRHVYTRYLALIGICQETMNAVLNLAASLSTTKRFTEAKLLLQKRLLEAEAICGADSNTALQLLRLSCVVVCTDPACSVDDLSDANTRLEALVKRSNRVFGDSHPQAIICQKQLKVAKVHLAHRLCY